MLEARWDSHVAPVPNFFPHPDTLSVTLRFSEHYWPAAQVTALASSLMKTGSSKASFVWP